MADVHLKPPGSPDFHSKNLAEHWKKWKEEFNLHVYLALTDADDKRKVKMFTKYLIDNIGRYVYMTLTFDEPNEED